MYNKKFLTLAILLIITIVFLCAFKTAYTQTTQVMSVDEIKPGMTGVVKTVLSGTKIEEYRIEVIGVLKNVWGPKQDLIVIRTFGGILDKTGPVHGMSGSPVYIDGKLIGAYSRGMGNFPLEHIVGVTPISCMLDILKIPEEKMGQGERMKYDTFEENINKLADFKNIKLSDLGELGNLLGESESNLTLIHNNGSDIGETIITKNMIDGQPALSQYIGTKITPLKTPLSISGCDDIAFSEISKMVEQWGFIPVQGGSMSGVSSIEKVDLQPGSAVGLQLMSGDMNFTATGTVTYRDGNKILAFGHMGLFIEGRVEFPMVTSYTHTVFPSSYASSKISSPLEVVGTITQDRLIGIAGEIGESPKLIPVEIKYQNKDSGFNQTYHFDIVNHRFLTSQLVGSAVYRSILSAEKSFGNYTINVQTNINIKNHPSITKNNLFSDLTPPTSVAERISAEVGILMDNPFEDIRLEGISISISLENKRKSAEIKGMKVNKSIVKPGDTVELTVFLKPYLGNIFTQKTSITIPQNTPEGRLIVLATDFPFDFSMERKRAPGKFLFENFEQVRSFVKNLNNNNDLIIKLITSQTSFTVNGKELDSLPLSVASVMGLSKQSGDVIETKFSVLFENKIPLEYFLIGQAVIAIDVNYNAK